MQPLLQEIYHNIYRMSLPIPVPLKAINIYLFMGQSGWSIVDCGFHNDESEKVWHKVFRELNIDFSHVSQMIVTHYHPDHYGGAGWLQELTGAPVLLLDKEKKYLDRIWHDQAYPEQIRQFFIEYGMPEKQALDVKKEYMAGYAAVSPYPKEFQLLSNGEEIQLGDYRFQTIWSPGHTEGLMTLWCEQEGIFISNDLVLPNITPNISFYVDSVENPLNDFLISLRKIKDLPAVLTLPGHRQVITNLKKRVEETIDHHFERFVSMKQILNKNQNLTDHGVLAWDISKGLFGTLSDPVQLHFAFAETLSHLEYLVHANEIKKVLVDGKYYYYL